MSDVIPTVDELIITMKSEAESKDKFTIEIPFCHIHEFNRAMKDLKLSHDILEKSQWRKMTFKNELYLPGDTISLSFERTSGKPSYTVYK